jgi:shikimate dehydrogenase
MPETFGLIGWPLKHTSSPKIFKVLRERFVLRPAKKLSPTVWEGLTGFTVTIPHKQSIIPFLSRLSVEAKAIGAVNCVFNGRGYNTDAAGFADALDELGYRPKKAVIFGRGGGAKAAAYALKKKRVKVQMLGRGKKPRGRADFYVNATPLGMKGFPNKAPAQSLPGCVLAFDLTYGRVTPFMKLAPAALDGKSMLVYQALRAWELWRGKKLSPKRRRALKNDIMAKLWPSVT